MRDTRHGWLRPIAWTGSLFAGFILFGFIGVQLNTVRSAAAPAAAGATAAILRSTQTATPAATPVATAAPTPAPTPTPAPAPDSGKLIVHLAGAAEFDRL